MSFLQIVDFNDIGSSMKNIDLEKYNVNYPYLLEIERTYNASHGYIMMGKYEGLAYPIVGAYLIVIYLLQMYMKNRPAYNLQFGLFLWNAFWVFATAFGLTRSIPELGLIIEEYGLTAAICLARQKEVAENPVLGIWGIIFVFSKVGELGDTIFLILRKRKVTFLHWYHHATVLFYCWISYSYIISTARLFIFMNGLVHCIMYTYFAISALNIKISRKVAICITVVQISQMVFGTLFNVWAYLVKQAGNECHVTYDNIKVSLIIYMSYVVLFSRFFVEAYKKEFGIKEKMVKSNSALKEKEK